MPIQKDNVFRYPFFSSVHCAPSCFTVFIKKSEFFMESKKLYVGGLSYNSTEQGLHGLFSQSGKVDSVKIISDRDTGRSKGFAFIEMASLADAELAVKDLNGRPFDGRTLTVNEAKPQAPRESRGGGAQRW